MTLVRVLLAQDTTDSRKQAVDLIKQLYDFVVYIHNTRFQIDVLALQALLRDSRGEGSAALESLTNAVELAEPGGFILLFVDLGPQMADLLKRLQKQNVAVDYIETILAAFRDDEQAVVPEAILHYLRSGQFVDIIPVHRSIISTYLDDFSKYATEKTLLRLQKVFNFVPRSVGKKIKYSNISRDEAAREIRSAIELLTKARVICPVFHSHCSGLPLQAEIDEFTYKALFLDIGLMNRICGLDWLAISALDDRQLINEGAMAEQFIGQHLFYFRGLSDPPELCYWLRQQKSANAEVDYVISQGDLITPVEVKAGKSGTLKSMLQFVYSKNARIGVRFDLNPPSIQKVKHSQRQADSTGVITFDLISLPLYMVGQLARILSLYRTSRLLPK